MFGQFLSSYRTSRCSRADRVRWHPALESLERREVMTASWSNPGLITLPDVEPQPGAKPHHSNVIGATAINGGFNHVVPGDYNGDGRHDLLFLDQSTGQNRWFFGRADGGFDFREDIVGWGGMNHYDHVVAGDFNGDGRTDLLGHTQLSGANRWFFSRPEGDFLASDDLIGRAGINGDFDHVVAGDFNGDGRDDVLFHDRESGQNRWFLRRADGGLDFSEDRIGRAGVNGGFDHVVAGDFNGDGRDDLLFHDFESGQNRWFFSRPDATFDFSEGRISTSAINTVFDNVAAGDFNGDGRDDLLFHSTANGQNRWFLANADAMFDMIDSPVNPQAIDRLASGHVYQHLAAGDFDGNGAADALFHCQGPGLNQLVRNDPPPAPPLPPPPPTVTAAIHRLDTRVSARGRVRFLLSFQSDVAGLELSDLRLSASGKLSGGRIVKIQALNSRDYIVTATVGQGSGKVTLGLNEAYTIAELGGQPLTVELDPASALAFYRVGRR